MKKINLLTIAYKRPAERYISAQKTAVGTAVIFLLCILVVSVSTLVVGLLQSAVYQSAAVPEAAEAERLHRQAARARQQNENAARYFANENLDTEWIAVVAAAADGLSVSGIELDGRERRITVNGAASSEELLTAFVTRLQTASGCTDITVAELEHRDACFYFLLELRL